MQDLLIIDDSVKTDPDAPAAHKLVHIGIDWALPGSDCTVIVFRDGSIFRGDWHSDNLAERLLDSV